MKKVFKLKNLDCANCAAKMETAISKIAGVDAVTVNFMTQKLSLEASDDVFATALEGAKAAIGKVEPDCIIL
ncbi:MAG: heavy-metal-associated domain-containing protein [Clostridiales bacterium]|nr:heavy-metal-associated domain-containing protein [Clostridiales bacterium]